MNYLNIISMVNAHQPVLFKATVDLIDDTITVPL